MKILDFRKQDDRYFFRLPSGEDFQNALDAVKTRFDPRERDFDDDTKEWSVPVSENNEATLCEIFENAETCITFVKAQLRMF